MYDSDFNNLKEEVYKCSKCGLCNSICPVYINLKNEMYSPRGRYIILNNFFTNNKKFGKSFIKNSDICLNCNLCKNFCPSSLDSYKIFTEIKKCFGYKYSFMSFSSIFHFYLFFKSLFKKKNKIKLPNLEKFKGKVYYFEGCINKYIDSADKSATLQLINKAGFKTEKIISNCCGYPYLSDGNIKRYEENIENIANTIKDDIDYIVCSCDTCFDTLSRSDSAVIKEKLIRLDEFLYRQNILVEKNTDSVYFKPLIRTDDNITEPKEINEKGLCSGGENFLFLKYPELYKIITRKTKEKLSKISEKNIITSCNLSKQSLKKLKTGKNILTYAEFADKYTKD